MPRRRQYSDPEDLLCRTRRDGGNHSRRRAGAGLIMLLPIHRGRKQAC